MTKPMPAKKMVRTLALAAATLIGAFVAPMHSAFAVPEMARFGYFSCTACHVSPAGGGALTPYGRALSAERLSTWSAKDEEKPLNGVAGDLPDWLIVGGDARFAQVHVETAGHRDGRFIRMQKDLDVGVALPHVTIVGAGGPYGESSAHPEDEGKASWRQYFIKLDAATKDSAVALRAGRFFPRFGLNIPEHTSNIRAGLGFDQGKENENAEATWSTESNELALTRMVGIPKNSIDGSKETGWTADWAYSLFGKHRIGASALSGELNDDKRVAYGLHGVFALNEKWFWMTEADRQRKIPKAGQGHDELYLFNRLGFEPVQGVVPFLLSEVTEPNARDATTRTDLWGLGTQWYPRPHIDFEGLAGATLIHANYTFVATAYFIAHYYL